MERIASACVTVLWAALTVLHPSAADAHQTNTSYATARFDDAGVSLVFSVDEADLRLLFPDLDTNEDGILWTEEALAGTERTAAWVAGHVAVRADGRQLDLSTGDPEVHVDRDDNLFVRVPLRAAVAAPRRVEIDLSAYLQPPLLAEHRNLLKVTRPGQRDALALLSRERPLHVMQLGPEEPPESLLSQVGRFVWLGVEHIWIGYDHIMFLLALIVVGTRLGSLIKIVSAFTVAHSITLVLAALEVVSLPSRWVESGIALSIAYVAAENFWLRDSRHRWILTFVFGFVHGFGFANVLRDLGLPTEGLVASLLAFNVGVEIGQVAIVAVVFPAILWLARQPFHDRAVQVISGVILLFGLGWLVERVFDLSYMPL